MKRPPTFSMLAMLWLTAPTVLSQTLNATLLQLIQTRMNESSTASWEIGTRAETLLELDFPAITVFSDHYLTPTPPTPATLSPVLSIARDAVNSMTNEQLVADSSAGDPASIGCAVLLGNYTNAPGANWVQAAASQLDALLNHTPRSVDGAISHRTEYVQLWSDFIYMVPPFMAYYGVLTTNTTLISASYNQIKLYRSYLFDSNASLWRHVTMATPAPDSPTGPPSINNPNGFNDTGHWSTGNGWAAGGMLRVLATITNSPFAKQFSSEQSDLQDWIGEIHSGMSSQLGDSGLFNNYADESSSFPDASSTAVFAATVYRAVTLFDPSKYSSVVSAAERARTALYANNGTTHFDSNGWLTPVVDPNAYLQAGTESPEGQSFVLQMNNNWQAWKAAGSKKSGAAGTRPRDNIFVVGTMASLLLGFAMM